MLSNRQKLTDGRRVKLIRFACVMSLIRSGGKKNTDRQLCARDLTESERARPRVKISDRRADPGVFRRKVKPL